MPLRTNLHTHASFSEQAGSYDGHLYQAHINNFDAVLFTEHDTMMFSNQVPPFTFAAYRQQFNSGYRALVAESSGNPAAGSSAVIEPDVGLGRPVLTITATGAHGSAGSLGHLLDERDAGSPTHHSILAQTPHVDVRLDVATGSSALYVRFDLSDHPAYGSRPAGGYALEYRFVTAGGSTPSVQSRQGQTVGVIPITVPAGLWTAQRLNLLSDAATLFGPGGGASPEPGDNTLHRAHFGGQGGPGATVRGAFKDFRVERPQLDLIALQGSLLDAYAGQSYGLVVAQGMELSWGSHVGHLGGTVFLGSRDFDYSKAVTEVHAHGGLATINHPFGTTEAGLLSSTQQDAILRQAVAEFLPSSFFDADMIEIYPNQRGGCDMARHLELWDTASRNAVFLTAVSSNDDHGGTNWLREPNPGYTTVYAAARSMNAIQRALAGGHAFIGVLGRFAGSLDLTLGSAPMGSVQVSSTPVETAYIVATDVPAGGAVQLVQGPVDGSGSNNSLTSDAAIVTTISGARFGAGTVPVRLNGVRNTFTRAQVITASGLVVALSQPVWHVDATPSGGVPFARRVTR